ncbi:uncharacterized protein [Aristolochia californica]
MQCVPCESNNSVEKVVAEKDPDFSSIIERISNQRCFLLTLVTLELDAFWKHFVRVALPLQPTDKKNCLELGSHVNMDIQGIVSSPAGSFQDDQQITHWKVTCSGKSLILQSSSGANVLQETQSKGSLNKRNKAARDPLHSFQHNSNKSSGGLSGLIWIGSDAALSANCINGMSKVDKPAKKCSRKVKKKGKHYKRSSSQCSILHEEDVQSNSCSQSSENLHTENMVMNTGSTDLSGLVEKFHDDTNNEVANSSSTPTSCISFNDVTNESEMAEFIHQDSNAENYKWNQSRIDETSTSLVNSSSIIHHTNASDTKAAEPPLKQSDSVDYISSGNDVLDLFLDGWNSDATNNGSISVEASPFLKEQAGNDSLDSGITSDCSSYSTLLDSSLTANGYFPLETSGSLPKEPSSGDWFMILGSTNADRARADSQECSSTNSCSAASGKRWTKKLLGSTRKVGNQSSSVNVHGRTGKENNHSVWQRVRKNGEFICKAMCDSPVVSRDEAPLSVRCDTLMSQTRSDMDKSPLDEMPTEQDGLEGKSAVVNCGSPSIKADGEPLWVNVSKFKKGPGRSGKQEHKSNSRKGHNCGKTNSTGSARKIGKQKESVEIFYQRVNVSSPENAPSSVSQDSAVYLEDKKLPEDVHNAVPNTYAEFPQTFTPDCVDKMVLPGTKSDCGSHLPQDNECQGPSVLGPEDQHSECGKQAHSSNTFLQKWVPVGIKDSVATNRSDADTMVTSHLAELAADYLDVKDQEIESFRFEHGNSNTLPIRKLSTVEGGGRASELRYQTINHSSPCSLTTESKDQEVQIDSDTEKILQVVNDAYRIQIECERIQMVINGPLAEFERVLYSASPAVSRVPIHRHCSACAADQVAGDSLCRHRMPNICLASLWEWYERHGSYGLEVKAVDFQNSKRLGAHHFEFRAYFVPFLSAVQLFGKRRSGISNNKVAESCAVDTTEEDPPKPSFPPILAMLVPQPCKEDDPRSIPSTSGFSDSDSSFACRSGALFDEAELLFEYFESEQPQQRQPLFEKIKELVRGEATSNCRIFGDPKNLESLHLHDLHPSSW